MAVPRLSAIARMTGFSLQIFRHVTGGMGTKRIRTTADMVNAHVTGGLRDEGWPVRHDGP